jgi:outer membrane protein insertion porin family
LRRTGRGGPGAGSQLALISVLLAGLVLAFTLHSATSVAQTTTPAPQPLPQAGVIQKIEVQGTQRIEPATVMTYLPIRVGDPFDPVLADRALRALFATGLFADVVLRRSGNTLIIVVVENPIINRIAFEGNRSIEDPQLESEITLRPRTVYTRTRVQKDVERILAVYRASGRFGATVEPKIIQLDQNRVDLVFEIDEGDVTYIRAINFIGNREFTDGELREKLASTETAFWRILSSTDTYDPDRLTFDRELLRRFYLSEGFADFRVVSAVAELLPDQSGFVITFTIEEGERYRFGKIDLQTTLRDLDPETLRDELTTEEGDWYDAGQIDRSIARLTDKVGDLGYAFVDIRPRVERDREKQLINLTYDIQEGPKVFVERIDITGNVRTLDYVLRREFQLVEGDAFNATKLRRSQRRLQNLGFFKTVKVTNEPGSTADRTVVKVEVEEQPTGEISFGAGYSSTDGLLGQVSLRERNLLGRGQDLRFVVSISSNTSSVDLGFTEPYFLGRNILAGFDAFHTSSQDTQSSFTQVATGGGLRLGYALSEDIRELWRYSIRRTDITDISSNASTAIQAEAGVTTRSIVGHEISYDTRDNRFEPSKGVWVRLRTDVAGLGGDIRYLKNVINAAYFRPVFEDVTASIRGEAGYIFGLGQDTHIVDRFILGSALIRGFATSGIGPRDTATGDSLRGRKYYAGTVELTFPLGLPEDLQVRGRVFADVGALWDPDKDATPTTSDSSSPRISVGAGLTWVSPLGPIQIDLGYPIVKEDFDRKELVRFNFGTRF